MVLTRRQVRPLVLVLTDSLGFVGPRAPHPVDDPRLWPNVMGAALGIDVEVFGGFGWTARDAWYAVAHDPRLWSVLRDADAVVLAVGSFDAAPGPLPSLLWKRITIIRSDSARRVVSAAHRRVVPGLSRLFSHLPGGGPVVLRPRVSVHFLGACLRLLRQKRRGVAVVGMTPIVAEAKVFGGVYKTRVRAEKATREWAASEDVPLLDTPAVVGEHMLSGRGNPDGMHMGWEGHTMLGLAFAAMLPDALSTTPAPIGPPTRSRTTPESPPRGNGNGQLSTQSEFSSGSTDIPDLNDAGRPGAELRS